MNETDTHTRTYTLILALSLSPTPEHGSIRSPRRLPLRRQHRHTHSACCSKMSFSLALSFRRATCAAAALRAHPLLSLSCFLA